VRRFGRLSDVAYVTFTIGTTASDVTDDAVAEAFAQAMRRGHDIRDVDRWVCGLPSASPAVT